jgi:hypothetical protein
MIDLTIFFREKRFEQQSEKTNAAQKNMFQKKTRICFKRRQEYVSKEANAEGPEKHRVLVRKVT